ncbi:MAG: hypothetical protein SOU51_04605, partial [Collinsella sp.]|nr:hypothetical protein [Collinsella sp.]
FRFGMTKASQYIPFIIMGSVFAFSFVISALPDAVKALVRDNIAFVMQPENTVVFSLLLIGISALSYCASALVSLAVCAKRDY